MSVSLPTIEDFKRQENNTIKTQQMVLLFSQRLQVIEEQIKQKNFAQFAKDQEEEIEDNNYENGGITTEHSLVIDDSAAKKKQKQKRDNNK